MGKSSDELFIEIALENGLLTEEQVRELDEAAAVLKQMGMQRPRAQIAREKNLLSARQVAKIHRELRKRGVLPKLGGYEIIAKLGEGGMGAVYKARQISLDRIVALKVLPLERARSKQYVQRFAREARLAAKVSHPNLIPVYDVGMKAGWHYIAMEFVPGTDVAKHLQSGPLTEERALEIILGVARGLEAAHEEGIIHRDIKPSNIMLTKKGLPKVADLGLARDTEDDRAALTRSGMAMGTPHYMSPEQCMGKKDIDARTDIYSLGASLFHMLCNRVPFEGDSTLEIIQKQINEPLPDPKALRPDLSDGVVALIKRMMEKDREKRFQNCHEIIAAIEAVEQGMAPMARMATMPIAPPSRPSRSLPPHSVSPPAAVLPPETPPARPARAPRATSPPTPPPPAPPARASRATPPATPAPPRAAPKYERPSSVRTPDAAVPVPASTPGVWVAQEGGKRGFPYGVLIVAVVVLTVGITTVATVIKFREDKKDTGPPPPIIKPEDEERKLPPVPPKIKPKKPRPVSPSVKPKKPVTPQAANWPFDAREANRRQKSVEEHVGLPAGWRVERRRKTVASPEGDRTAVITYYINTIGMEFVCIPAGEFMMGSRDSAEEVARKGGGSRIMYEGEHPQHRVQIAKSFFMAACEVTQGQYETVMGKNPSRVKGRNRPVSEVPWSDALGFCRRMTAKERVQYSLPTEGEWEYACRAGTATPFYFGETIATNQANYCGDLKYGNGRKGSYHRSTTEVGSFPPNAFGLYDMHGNVWERCRSLYKSYPYRADDGREDISAAGSRVLRGGAWYYSPSCIRSAYRIGLNPVSAPHHVGFRVTVSFSVGRMPERRPAVPPTPTRTPSARPTVRAPDSLPRGWTSENKRPTVATPRGNIETDITYYANTIGMKFVKIPAGTLVMGSGTGRRRTSSANRIQIGKPLYMGAHEVTQAQYQSIMGSIPSAFEAADQPVKGVSRENAAEFCNRLAARERVVYRLPAAAEWEYACRAGSSTDYYWGARVNGNCAWYSTNSGRKTHPVGKKLPNLFGLYDMSGNVWEWCLSGTGSSATHTLRGGSATGSSLYLRSAYSARGSLRRVNVTGFRVVVTATATAATLVPRPAPVPDVVDASSKKQAYDTALRAALAAYKEAHRANNEAQWMKVKLAAEAAINTGHSDVSIAKKILALAERSLSSSRGRSQWRRPRKPARP